LGEGVAAPYCGPFVRGEPGDQMQAWMRSGTAVLAAALVVSSAAAGLARPSGPTPTVVPVASGTDRLPMPATDGPVSRGAARDSRPNVVFVMTDDMRDDDLKWMPQTQRLIGDQGLEFTDAISPHPLCCPARAELVTGQFAQNNGVQHNAGPFGGFQALDPTHEISSWFDEVGYQTGFVGKFLNGYTAQDTPPTGWTRWDALVAGVYDYFDFAFADDDDSPKAFKDSYVTDVIAQRTNDTVRRFASEDEPFLLFSWHLAPHYRLDDGKPVPPPSAPEDADLFADARPPSLQDPSFNEPDVADQPRPFRHRPAVDVDTVLEEHRARLRALQSVDRAVGSLVDTLRETGELDHTVIVFSSDNGYSLGEHRFIGKNVLTQPVLQVPLLVRGPGIAPGTTSDLPVTLVDLPTTFAAIAGATPGWVVDGTSVVPTLRGLDQPFRDTTLVQTGDESGDGWAYRGVRTDRYLYGVNGSDAFLYDDDLDPHQLVNRIDDPAYADVRAALEERRSRLITCRGWLCNQTFGALPDPVAIPVD
jgi:arylsulfatase A-like enzyme